MKFTKEDLRERSRRCYTNLMATYGMSNALTISKQTTKLIQAEKKRRKEEE